MQLWILKQRYGNYRTAMEHSSGTSTTYILDRSIYGDWAFAHNGFSLSPKSPSLSMLILP